MDLNSGLALAATAAADQHGHPAGSELLLMDGLKARSKRGWGGRDVARVPLPHRAKAVQLNCSADLAAVHCGQRVMLFRVQRPEGGGHPKRNPRTLLLLSQHHLNGASLVDCRFSRSRPNVLLACEVRWGAAVAGELWALRLDCDAAEGSGLFANPLGEAKLEGVEGRDVTAVGWDGTEYTLVVGTRSGTATTHRIDAAACAAPRAAVELFDAPVTALQWHPSGGVLLAGSHDGLLRVCTLALHPLPVARASAGNAEDAIMSLGAVADSATARPTHVQWEIPAPHAAYDAATPLACGCVLATEGSRSVALLSVDAGLADRGGLSAHAITAHLLAENEPRMAVQAAAAAGDARDRYLALSSAFHSLTRLQDATMDDAVMQELMEAITAEATSASAEPNVVARYLDLCRLYGQRLLAVERAEAAWAFSDALGDGACLEDVYVHAVRHGAARLAACAQTSLLAANAHAPPQERPLSIQQLKQFRTLEATYLESLAAVAP